MISLIFSLSSFVLFLTLVPTTSSPASCSAATTLHTIWNVPTRNVKLTEPRWCPRCPDLVLERKWFSETKQVEIDQCPKCGGIWLDAGEFTRIYDEIKGAKIAPPGWASAMAEAAALVEKKLDKAG